MLGVNLFTLSLWFFQEGEAQIGFDPVTMWRHGLAGPVGGHSAVHHVVLVDRGHD